MLKLKSIRLRNWCKTAASTLEFPDRGFVFLRGINHATIEESSNGCHGAGQGILMQDGTVKPVEAVRVGDLLASPDSHSKTVVSLCRGEGNIHTVAPRHGEPFTVNEDHVLALCLAKSTKYKVVNNTVLLKSDSNKSNKIREPDGNLYFTATVKEYLSWPRTKRAMCMLYLSPRLNFKLTPSALAIPPRILGLWLGDGTSSVAGLTTGDAEIEQEWRSYAASLGLHVAVHSKKFSKCKTLTVSAQHAGRGRNLLGQYCDSKKNTVLTLLRKYNLIDNKHIPKEYKTASVEARLALLSGLLDTDGYLANGYFEISSVSPRLASDIVHLCRGLGLTCRYKNTFKRCQTGAGNWYFRISIFGRIEDIPTCLPRKRARPSKSNRRSNITGFTVVPKEYGNYYGFTLSGDGLYLLDSYFVTHNSGKTSLGEAINRTLLGQSLCPALASYSKDRAGDTYLDLRAELRGQPLRVELGYKCPEFPDNKGEGLRFTFADQPPLERPLVAQTRAELTAMIGVSPEVSLWTVFLDGERLKFNRLAQAEALSLLMQALNQPPWEKFKERAERQRVQVQVQLTSALVRLAQLQTSVADLQREVQAAERDLRETEATYAAAEALWARARAAHEAKVQSAAAAVLTHSGRRDQLKRDIKAVQAADATACGQLELELSRLGSERRTAEHYLTGWSETVATDRAALHHAESDLQRLREGKTCPTCRQETVKASGPEQLAAQERKIAKLKVALTESNAGKMECEKCLHALDEEIAQQHKARQTLRSAQLGPLARELEESEARLASADRQLRLAEHQAPTPPDTTALTTARAVLAERQQRQAAQAAAQNVAATAVAEAERAFSIAQYWVKGFSPEGIPNLVLRQTIGPLNEAAQLVSTALSGGLVQISFSAETELITTGAMKPKLVTEVHTRHGATEFLRNSKGEASFANLIIAETQTQVGRVLQRVGYRWFDEVANSLSGSARRTLYTGLKRQAHDLGLLTFVVDHHDEASHGADHVLVAEKSALGLTTYRWE